MYFSAKLEQFQSKPKKPPKTKP